MSDNPYSPIGYPSQQQGDPKILGEIKAQATTSLIVGIISIFCCGIVLAPFAIYRGNKAKKLIDQHRIGYEHRGLAQAGFIIGIVALVLNIIGMILYVLAIAVQVAAQNANF